MKRIAFCLALVVTLVAFYYAIERWRWRSAWEKYTADARTHGLVLEAPETVAPDVSDELNATKVPFFTSALSTQTREIFDRLKGTEIFSSQESHRRGNMAAAKNELLSHHLIEEDGLPAEQSMLQLFEREFAGSISDLKIAADRPYFQSPLTDAGGIPFREPPNVFEAYQLAAMDAEVLIANGRLREASDVIVTMLQLGRLLRQEPSTLTAVIEMLGTQLLIQDLWSGLTADDGWDAQILAEIMRTLNQSDFIKTYSDACIGDRQYFNASLRRIISDSSWPEFFTPIHTPKWAKPLWKLYPRGWLYRNQLMANSWFDKRQELIDVSGGTLQTGEALFEMNRKGLPLVDALWVNWTANSWDYPEWISISEIELRQVRLACAAESYYRGKWKLPGRSRYNATNGCD
jgi:hypothetical protein